MQPIFNIWVQLPPWRLRIPACHDNIPIIPQSPEPRNIPTEQYICIARYYPLYAIRQYLRQEQPRPCNGTSVPISQCVYAILIDIRPIEKVNFNRQRRSSSCAMRRNFRPLSIFANGGNCDIYLFSNHAKWSTQSNRFVPLILKESFILRQRDPSKTLVNRVMSRQRFWCLMLYRCNTA